MALVIVVMILYVIFKVKSENKLHKYQKANNILIISALALTLIQIILGTQIREYVDTQTDILGENAKALWLLKPPFKFYMHRSFSILVFLVNVLLYYRIKQNNLGFKKINWVLFLIALEVITGILMYYVDFPFGSQTLHLVLASLLFGVQFYLVLESLNLRKNHKTLYL